MGEMWQKAVWQKFQCAVLTASTIPMEARAQSATARRTNESVLRWNNIVRNLDLDLDGLVIMILMDLENQLRALDQARFTTDGIHFESQEDVTRGCWTLCGRHAPTYLPIYA